jgi:hypothetical protein
MGRGVATYRKRDLKIAMEVAGDRIVKVTKDGSIVLIPAKPGEGNGEAPNEKNDWDIIHEQH